MIAWMIISLVTLIVIIGLSVYWDISKREKDIAWPIITNLVLVFFLLITVGTMIEMNFQYKQGINNFKLQSEYIQTHEAGKDIEDASLTATKMELNEWLYTARYCKQTYGSFSLYPDEVLLLEPIE